MAHLPEDAALFFDDPPTHQTGKMRLFETASLAPGYNYAYNVKVVWHENGKWVHQSQRVVFKAGDILCVDLIPASEKKLLATIAANLAGLSPADRKLAEAQRSCAVQDHKRLGEMGAREDHAQRANGISVLLGLRESGAATRRGPWRRSWSCGPKRKQARLEVASQPRDPLAAVPQGPARAWPAAEST